MADVEISVQKKRDVIAMSKGVCHKDLGKFGEAKSFMTGCLYNWNLKHETWKQPYQIGTHIK